MWTVNSTLSWRCNYVMQWNLAWSVATDKKLLLTLSALVCVEIVMSPIRQKRPNFRIPYFCPSKCRPLLLAARNGCPPSPPPLPAVTAWSMLLCVCETTRYNHVHVRLPDTDTVLRQLLHMSDSSPVAVSIVRHTEFDVTSDRLEQHQQRGWSNVSHDSHVPRIRSRSHSFGLKNYVKRFRSHFGLRP